MAGLVAGGPGEDAWARLARFGPFFAVGSATTTPAGWSPVTALAERLVVSERIAAVGAALLARRPGPGPQIPLRVAASVTLLGLCARLTAVALAAEVDGLSLPPAGSMAYADELGGPFPLAVLFETSEASEPTDPTPSWPDSLLSLLRPVVAAVAEASSLSPRIAWGNVASGLGGAAQMITAAEPRAAERVVRAVDAALATEPLLGALEPEPRADGRRYRTTCCLIYQLAADRTAVCSDCVLVRSSPEA